MQISNVINSTHQILELNVTPILIFLAFSLFLSISKRIFRNRIIQKLNWLDIIPFLSIYIIHSVTMTGHGYSWLPLFVLIWMIFGIVFATIRVIVDRELVMKVFIVNFWRISDLYWLFLWILVIIIKIV